MRQTISLNANWRFKKADESRLSLPGFDDGNLLAVDLPHTWNAVDGSSGFDFHKGASWYRKVLPLPEDYKNKRLFLEFLGANSITDVYVNGNHVGQHRGGYSTFRFDITDFVECGGENLIAVRVDNTVVDDVYPQMADFTFYGGIYRDVNLIAVDPLHFDLLDHGASGVATFQMAVSSKQADLSLVARVTNHMEAAVPVGILATLRNHHGEVVTYAVDEALLDPGTGVRTLSLSVEEPILWQGIENPYLYQLTVSLLRHNEVLDEVAFPVGLRSFTVDPQRGLLLNGKKTRLNGVARHQDRLGKGWAISEEDQEEDMALIKEVGANAIRLAHYQHSPSFYDLCDREGMILWAEIPFISIMSKEDHQGVNAKSQLVELIRQNINHPAIFFWGVQNEIQIGGERPEVRNLVAELHALAKAEDPTRLTTMANVFFTPMEDPYNRMTDTLGYNLYFGWYTGKSEDFAGWLDTFHGKNPDVPLGISEYGAEGIIQYHSDAPKVKDYTEEYHALFHETVWEIFAARDYLWSTFVWNMFDFGANIRDEGGVRGRNNKGLVTYDRKVRKDAFYVYKAHWSKEPFVHIAGKRHYARTGDTFALKVYTNLPQVTLHVNGIPQGTVSGQRIAAFQDLPLLEGRNTVTVTATDGTLLCTDHAFFLGTEEAVPHYTAPVSEKKGPVANWFQMPREVPPVAEPYEITPEVYSTKSSVEELMAHPKTRAILKEYLGATEQKGTAEMVKHLPLELILSMASDQFDAAFLDSLNSRLTQIRKPS